LLSTRGASARAASRIVRNARFEAALGGIILAVVGALGIAVPAMHDQIRWPFDFRVSFAQGLLPSVVPAYPTTYVRAPFRYTVESVARGSLLYQANCAVCHGRDGHGDGPAASTLAMAPPELASAHLLQHSDGDLYWWIAHGIGGAAMPAFGQSLDESAIWDLVNFVKTLGGARLVQSSDAARAAIEAPQFTYQIGRAAQQAVPDAHDATLLVLYSLPRSLERLLQLAEARALANANVRVIALPLRSEGSTVDDATAADRRLARISATASAEVAKTYLLFASEADASAPDHVEFLIDRTGRLRARWDSANAPNVSEIAHLASMSGVEGEHQPSPGGHAGPH
jgi:putative copper resistance protein D